MPSVAMYNMEGSKVGDINLSDAVFGAEVNKSVLHQVVVNYLANQRQGTQSTLTRAEVRGGGIKPWRQKGTGRARQGSIRSPQWTKGGIALGPKPRDYSYTVNKKVKRVAMRSALSSKVAEGEMIVMDNIALEQIKTKAVAEMLSKLEVASKALIVTCDNDELVVKSARNIPGVKTAFVGCLNVYDILNHDKFIITKAAVEKIEEVYA
ncbi:MAG: 50S ribosomal protein L4 [Ruminococcaceae bacterium]|nr:50S ribosomal protein L4 [Oscillospiraceae bacterium]